MMAEPVIVGHRELRELAAAILQAAGADEENASIVADHLVGADLSGMSTHGVCHLVGYVADVTAGRIDPKGKPSRRSDAQCSALVSGGWTFGQVGALFAADLAAELADAAGVAVVGLVEAHHIGRLGHYVERLAERGLIGMIWAGGYGEAEPHTAPFGGRERVLGTNPVAMGFPGGDAPALTYDFATTAVAGMRVQDARRRGERLPAGSIVDADGHPSTDPADFFAGGAHVPFGGHKGYAISMGTEWLGRILTGSDRYAGDREVNPILGRQGVTFIALRSDLFVGAAQFGERSAEMIRRVQAVAPAPGVERVLVPGQLEHEARARRQVEGIPLDADVWASLQELGATVGAA
jgi:uncharacterized oxidoreductase